jgi:hypothetical protein
MSCSITSNRIRTPPELHRTMATQLSNPVIYMPDQPSKLSASEVPEMKAALSPSNDELDKIKSQVGAVSQSLDIDTLFYLHNVSRQNKEQSLQHWILTVTLYKFVLCVIIYLFLHVRVHHCISRYFGNNTSSNPDIEIPPAHSNMTEAELMNWMRTRPASPTRRTRCNRQAEPSVEHGMSAFLPDVH